jgi:hypothetical protein
MLFFLKYSLTYNPSKCIPELIQRILGSVVSEFDEVYNLGFINHYCKNVLHGQLGMTLINEMGLEIVQTIVTKEYKLSYIDFITFLGANNGIIAGGFVLSCITKRFFEAQDIDVYLRSKVEAEEIGFFLRIRGYKLKKRKLKRTGARQKCQTRKRKLFRS